MYIRINILLILCCTAIIRCNSTTGNEPVTAKPSRKTIMVVALTAESDFKSIQTDSTIYRPCNQIEGFCVGSPVPEITRVLLDDMELPFEVQADDDGLTFRALYVADSIATLYTGAKQVSIITSEGTASGEVSVPVERIKFNNYLSVTSGLKNHLTITSGCDNYEIGAWFTFFDNIMNFDIEDTIIKDTLFIIPPDWIDTVRSDKIQFFVSGVNGAMPINGESANMQGTAMGYLLARNMMYEMYSYTTETRRLLNKSASRMEQVPFPKASVSEHVRKLALQAYKNLQK